MAQRAVQLGGVPETDARWFFQQFIIAVDYCHRLGIANRDIKVRAAIACEAAAGLLLNVAKRHSMQTNVQHSAGANLKLLRSAGIDLTMMQLMLLQLDNVLLDGSQPLPIIKMCDFGYSKDEVAGSLCKTACGTPEYMAPEVGPLLTSSHAPSIACTRESRPELAPAPRRNVCISSLLSVESKP